MARKTTTAQEAPPKPKPLDPETIRAVCHLKADERLDLQRRIDKESDSVVKAEQALMKKRRDAQEAKLDAAAALDAHRAYKDKLSPKEYEAELKRLTKEKDAAAKDFDDTIQETNVQHGKVRKTLNELQVKADDLTRQWKFHVKRAEEAGLDVSEFWTPEKGIPDSPSDEKPDAEE